MFARNASGVKPVWQRPVDRRVNTIDRVCNRNARGERDGRWGITRVDGNGNIAVAVAVGF